MQLLAKSTLVAWASGFALSAAAYSVQPTYDYPFNGDCKSAGGTKASEISGANSGIGYATNQDGASVGVLLQRNLWTPSNFSVTKSFSAAAYCLAPNAGKQCILVFGNATSGNSIMLATGEKANQIELVYVKSKVPTTVLASVTVPDASTATHLYAFTCSYDNNKYALYVDGVKYAATEVPAELHNDTWNGYMQIGGGYGGNPNGYYTPSSSDPAYMDELVIWGSTLLSDDQMTELAAYFPVIHHPKFLFHFDGGVKSVGIDTSSLSGADSKPADTGWACYDGTVEPCGVFLKCNVNSSSAKVTFPFTAHAYALAASGSYRCLFSFGRKNNAIFLTTGANADDIALYQSSGDKETLLCSAPGDGIGLAKRLYTVTASADGKTFCVYVDGKPVTSYVCETAVTIGSGIQIGGLYGGFNDYKKFQKGNGNSYMDELIVYGNEFAPEDVAAAAKDYPAKALPLPQPTYDWPFEGNGNASTNSAKSSTFSKGNHTLAYVDSAKDKGLKLYCVAQTPSNFNLQDPKMFTLVAYATAPTSSKKIIWAIGSVNDRMIFLATGANANEVQLCAYRKDSWGPVVLATATVPNASKFPHLYTVMADATNSDQYRFFVDETEWETENLPSALSSLWSNFQIGGGHGGNPSGYGSPSDDGSYMDEFLIFDGKLLPAEHVSMLAERFPYDPQPKYDFPFNGDVASIGTDTSELSAHDKTPTYSDEGEAQGIDLPCNVGNSGIKIALPFTAMAYALAPTTANACLVAFGRYENSIFLTTGANANEICLACTQNSSTQVIASALVNNATTALHLYAVAAAADGKTFTLYVDGAAAASGTLETSVSKADGLQVGGWVGGNPSGYHKANTGYMSALKIYEYEVLSARNIAKAAAAMPCELKDDQPTYDFKFNGNGKSVGGKKDAEIKNGDRTLVYRKGASISIAENPRFEYDVQSCGTIVTHCIAPSGQHQSIVALGHGGHNTLFLATGANANEIELVCQDETSGHNVVTVLCTAKVDDVTESHCYAFTASADGKTYELYVDGVLAGSATLAAPFSAASQDHLQLGGWYGGTPSGYTKANTGYIDELIVYDNVVLDAARIAALATHPLPPGLSIIVK